MRFEKGITLSEKDELVLAEIDLDDCLFGKKTIFDFSRHRRVEHYVRITNQTAAQSPKK